MKTIGAGETREGSHQHDVARAAVPLEGSHGPQDGRGNDVGRGRRLASRQLPGRRQDQGRSDGAHHAPARARPAERGHPHGREDPEQRAARNREVDPLVEHAVRRDPEEKGQGPARERHRREDGGTGLAAEETPHRLRQSEESKPQGREEPDQRPARQRQARQSGPAEHLAGLRHRGQRIEENLHGLAPPPRCQHRDGSEAGRGHGSHGSPRGAEEQRDKKPEQKLARQEDLEERNGAGEHGGRDDPASASVGTEALQGHDHARGHGESRHHGVREDQGKQQVPPEKLGPPVEGRIEPPEDEGEIGGEGSPSGERHGQGARSHGTRRPAKSQHQREGPEGDVEAVEGVVGMDACPLVGLGTDQVRPHVVGQRDAREAGDLGRIAVDELPCHADVERGVDPLQVVEPEVTPGVRRLRGYWSSASPATMAAMGGSAPRRVGPSARRQGAPGLARPRSATRIRRGNAHARPLAMPSQAAPAA